MQIIERWTGRDADALRRALRMTADEFAVRVKASPRTVNYWRERPSSTPQAPIQRALDSELEAASDRAKAQSALFVGDSMHDPPDAGQLPETIDAHGLDPDEQARMRSVIHAPSHLDSATVAYLTQGLYGQRHADDSLGASVMIGPMSAIGEHRDAVDSLKTGIAGLPADQQGAEWMAEYQQALDRADAETDGPSATH
jgi:hypothetical protein